MNTDLFAEVGELLRVDCAFRETELGTAFRKDDSESYSNFKTCMGQMDRAAIANGKVVGEDLLIVESSLRLLPKYLAQ